MSTVFRVLFVCTGNICRSAQAEQISRARIAEHFPGLEPHVVVESAGTGALAGSAMPGKAAALSARHGGVPTPHSGRQLSLEQIKRSDLVLGMAAEHRKAVVRLLPRASRYAFTLTEFVALLENVAQNKISPSPGFLALEEVARLRETVKWASARRGYLSTEEATQVDILDPYRKPDATYEKSTGQIVEAIDRAQRAAVQVAEQVCA